MTSTKALEARARRAARACGFIARKSRRAWSFDNQGGFLLVDIETSGVVRGARYDLSAEDVLDFCKKA